MARNVKLSLRWDRWRRTRRRAMARSEMTEAAATKCSRSEALGRQRIARVTGLRAAMEAELCGAPKSDGSNGFFLVIDPSKVDLSGIDDEGPGHEALAQSPAERACGADRQWFAAHPGRNSRIRALIPGEFNPDEQHAPAPRDAQTMASATLQLSTFRTDAHFFESNQLPSGWKRFTLVRKFGERERLRILVILRATLNVEEITDEFSEAVFAQCRLAPGADVIGILDTDP